MESSCASYRQTNKKRERRRGVYTEIIKEGGGV
jgi:hypothetical protein